MQIMAHYQNVVRGHKGFVAAFNAYWCRELLETKVYVSYVVCSQSNKQPAARAYLSLENT